jgi:PAS domain S-box-containing protein
VAHDLGPVGLLSASGLRGPEHGEVFRSLFDHSGMCMANLDPDLRLREANTDFLAQFDLRPQDGYGRSFLALLHPTVRRRVGRDLAMLTSGERERVSGKVIIVRQDGALMFGDLTAVSTAHHDGSVDAVLVLVTRASRVGDEQAIVQGKVRLTAMDAKILEGVAAGVSTAKLATTLHMSRGGVEYRITALLRMLKAINRTELVSKAHSMGVFDRSTWPPSVLPEHVVQA